MLTTYRCAIALDNYEPPRRFDVAYVIEMTANDPSNKSGRLRYILDLSMGGAFKDATSSLYILDFGGRVLPLWVSGWNSAGERIFLEEFPLSGGRADDGRLIDMSGWMLGPRRTYHLKARKFCVDGIAVAS